MALKRCRDKRDFAKTPEPLPLPEHHASRLHYDFRLEVDGVFVLLCCLISILGRPVFRKWWRS